LFGPGPSSGRRLNCLQDVSSCREALWGHPQGPMASPIGHITQRDRETERERQRERERHVCLCVQPITMRGVFTSLSLPLDVHSSETRCPHHYQHTPVQKNKNTEKDGRWFSAGLEIKDVPFVPETIKIAPEPQRFSVGDNSGMEEKCPLQVKLLDLYYI